MVTDNVNLAWRRPSFSRNMPAPRRRSIVVTARDADGAVQFFVEVFDPLTEDRSDQPDYDDWDDERERFRPHVRAIAEAVNKEVSKGIRDAIREAMKGQRSPVSDFG